MANDPALMALADMLKQRQAQRVHPAQSPVFAQGPSPTALPPFQPPGGMMPAFTNAPQPAPAAPPPPAQAPPPPAAPVIAPGNQQPAPPPAADYGALAAPQALGAPGMMKTPQTAAELEQWRRLMDSMQFARQGA